ncbi:MAG: ImmA/IrrE family metallo-endopeptidase [Pseudobutyrivibrio sp.]|mgnify:CR=1 FL=1|nr:ImmA/IrrE family metallo-endopeptidase [Pseudobutyrivibrio sp.]
MRRSPETYDDIVKVIVDIFVDYDIKEFPINPKEVCKKLGVALIPYSEYQGRDRELLLKCSEYAFFTRATKDRSPSIYYNDAFASEGAIRFSIFHELKHYVCEDKDDEDDDLADYFARQFMCPTVYMILKKIDTVNEIMSYCGLSESAASYACSNIHKRRAKHGYTIFEHEKPLIELLDPVLLEVYGE